MTATDDLAVTGVTLVVDGTSVSTDSTAPYQFTVQAPRGHRDYVGRAGGRPRGQGYSGSADIGDRPRRVAGWDPCERRRGYVSRRETIATWRSCERVQSGPGAAWKWAVSPLIQSAPCKRQRWHPQTNYR